MLDLVVITVHGGDGGSGAVSFRREKGIPRGGPDGGHGGDGGSVILQATSNDTTLSAFRNRKRFVAARGIDGRGKNQYGKGGHDLVTQVPLGTEVWRRKGEGQEEFLGELLGEGDQLMVAQGGKGGRGNASFATATQQAPYVAEKGEAGEEYACRLELKLLADIGTIGKPNAGKSTLLRAATAATPKVAPYPFTTVEPVLGVVTLGWKSFVLAEIPGLLRGAHEGVGLGLEFLRHATRTRLLLHLVDGAQRDVVGAVRDVNDELAAYGGGLSEKPQIIVVNKLDMSEVRARQAEIREQLRPLGYPVRFISAGANVGVKQLMEEAAGWLALAKTDAPKRDAAAQATSLANRRRVEISKVDGVYVVECEEAARLVAGSDLRAWAGRVQVKRQLDRLGVTRALEEAGISLGDTVRFKGIELEW